MGSPGYMSPEQLRSARDVDARTDVWALGVILFELVSGRPPFEAEAITELTLKVAMDPTPPLDVPVPPGFEDVIRICLEKDPIHLRCVAELAALAPFSPPTPARWPSTSRVSRLSTNTRQKARWPGPGADDISRMTARDRQPGAAAEARRPVVGTPRR
jgi:serine/threonine-protein kinase